MKMRIQVSQWEVTKTSFPVRSEANHRRRKRSSEQNVSSSLNSNGNPGHIMYPPTSPPLSSLVLASFVEVSRRKYKTLKKRAKLSSKSGNVGIVTVLPTILLTGEHQIGIVGKTINNMLSEDFNSKFTSPPGEMKSFLHNVASDDDRGRICPNRVPAIYDGEQERVYALQRKNTKLVCWNAASPFQEIISVTNLSQPVATLSLVHLKNKNKSNMNINTKSLLIGSCIDGSVFIVHCADTVENKIRIEYIQTSKQSSKNNGAQYIGSHSHLVSKAITDPRSDKLCTESSHSMKTNACAGRKAQFQIAICQVFLMQNSNKVIVSLQEVHLDKDGEIETSSVKQEPKEAILSLVDRIPVCETDKTMSVTKANVIGVVEELNVVVLTFSVAMVATVEKKKSVPMNGYYGSQQQFVDGNQYFISVSLRTGEAIGTPVRLPENTKNTSIVGPAILAVETSDNYLIFYDTIRGGRIGFVSIDEIQDSSNDNNKIEAWSLVTDMKRTRIAVLYVKEEVLYVACSSIHSEESSLIESTRPKFLSSSGKISLAAGLSSCFSQLENKEIVAVTSFGQHRTIIKYCAGLPVKICDVFTEQQDFVAYGINLLNEAIASNTKIKKKNGSNSEHLSLCEAFDKVVGVITAGIGHHNGSVILARNSGNTKGLQQVTVSRLAENDNPNVYANLSRPLNLVPQCFIDATAFILLELLCSTSSSDGKTTSNLLKPTVKSDACLILKHLLRSGVLSSRYHFNRLLGERIDDIESKASSSILSFLSSFDPQDGEKLSDLNTSGEVVFEVLERCLDITELQMVAFLKYIISTATPQSIAAYFLQRRSLNRNPAYVELSDRFASLYCLVKKSTEERQEQEALSNKVILAGVSTLVDKIASFADCNDSFLREAINRVLTKKEQSLAAQLFVKLSPPHRFPCTENIILLHRKLQWLSCLGGCHDASRLRQAIIPELVTMEHLWSMHETKRVIHKNGMTKGTIAQVSRKNSKTKDNEMHPGELEAEPNSKTSVILKDAGERSDKGNKRKREIRLPKHIESDSDLDVYVIEEI